MAMETVDRVRRAEAEADRIEQEAKMEAAQIQAAADDRIRDIQKEAGIAAEQLMRLRCAEAENMAQEQDTRMLREAEESFAVLEEKARKRIPDAASRLAALIE